MNWTPIWKVEAGILSIFVVAFSVFFAIALYIGPRDFSLEWSRLGNWALLAVLMVVAAVPLAATLIERLKCMLPKKKKRARIVMYRR